MSGGTAFRSLGVALYASRTGTGLPVGNLSAVGASHAPSGMNGLGGRRTVVRLERCEVGAVEFSYKHKPLDYIS
jgi:hypothetical protein